MWIVKAKVIKIIMCSLLVLFFNCAAYGDVLNGNDCESLNFKKVIEIIADTHSQYVKNPFHHQRCVPISFKENDIASLDISHFAHSKSLFAIYQRFLKSNETKVTEVVTSNRGVVNFIKINADAKESKRFTKNINKTKTLKEKYIQWSFYHELMHLSARTEDKQILLTKKEATADIGAILMVSLANNMPIDEMFMMLNELSTVRKKDYKKGAVHHYSRVSFNNAYKNLSMLREFQLSNTIDTSESLSNIMVKIEVIAFDAQQLSVNEFKEKHLSLKGNDALNIPCGSLTLLAECLMSEI